MLKWLQLHVSLRRCAELERRLAVGIGNDGISQLCVLLSEGAHRISPLVVRLSYNVRASAYDSLA